MNVVVTGGGTLAPIDDVRHIANVSTGRFSATITEASLRRGAHVWHIATPSALLPFRGQATFNLEAVDLDAELDRLKSLSGEWRRHRARLNTLVLPTGTVAEYSRTLKDVLSGVTVDVAFLAMAVSDFEPEPHAGKIDSGEGDLVLRGHRTPKVIRSVRDWSPDLFLVGFKLLSRVSESRLLTEAEEACRLNRADVTIANDLESVRAGRHVVHLVRPGQPTVTLGPGRDMADDVVDQIFSWSRLEK